MTQVESVFVIDDDADGRRSVAALVEAMGLHAQAFESAEQFLQALRGDERGCVVADLRMPGMSGLELQERLAAMGSALPVIIISAFADVPAAVRAIRAGAITVLQKPYAPSELREGIHEALQRNAECRRHYERLSEIRRRLESLTAGEREVLELIAAGVPNKTIALRLKLGLRTVEARRHSIMHKMQAGSLAELLRMVFAADMLGKRRCATTPAHPAPAT
jgi:FixJ family two-component response regulator